MEAGQEPSDGKVSLTVIPSILEVPESLTLLLASVYIACGAVTCLVTVPIVEESKRLEGNFHNCHGSYIIWICIPQRLEPCLTFLV